MRLFEFAPTLLISLSAMSGAFTQNPVSSASAIYGLNGTITLKGNSTTPAVVVLDYGHNVEGFPTFEVLSASGNVSDFKIRYSETKAVLESNLNSDGPTGLAAAMDSYRVNIYRNIHGPTNHTNRLIQGGFRYQELSLTTAGELVLANVGVKPTTSTVPITSLPGSFECSDNNITRIWNAGARTIQLNEIPANSIPSFWEVTPEGSYVDSQAPQSLFGAAYSALTAYELNFQVKPVFGGFSFSVLADTLNAGIYIWVNIANGTISANAGTTESVTSDLLAQSALSNTLTMGEWHNVKALVNLTDVSISIDSVEILKLTQTASFYGSFGLGAALGQAAMFRNLNATTLTGTPVYSSGLTNNTFQSDFLMATNPLNTTVDGSKRDRIAYTGDLDVAVGATMASTYGTEYIRGTLDLFASYQLTPGFFVPTAKIQQEPLAQPVEANITGLIGYSFNLLCAVADFYLKTGDLTVANDWAPRIVKMLDWADSQTLSENGLFNVSNPAFGGDWDYYDPVQAGVSTKFNTLYAYTLQSCMTLLADAQVDTTPYSTRLSNLRRSINTHLWSPELSAYIVSPSVASGFGQDSNALAILSGVTDSTSNHTSASVLNALTSLSTPHGPLAFSPGTAEAGFRRLISPYASAYHLRAALSTGAADISLSLLNTLWAPMADPQNANFTGCFWETLAADGGPGLGDITSLCHAWGAGPTSELSARRPVDGDVIFFSGIY
ncbi:hypothetical protein E8E12_006661 [Didymella heteroderae]|uniref:Alpha-L-rhamnosidase six-hairpin glycosidase domain-containing protein n=1 Tax=Didymella heteroderae TaxID=1769908 RepID=A0A9P4WM58_9PLEO|nr:hypothetical protein E8E12_006661 [Didymella heteroderae]